MSCFPQPSFKASIDFAAGDIPFIRFSLGVSKSPWKENYIYIYVPLLVFPCGANSEKLSAGSPGAVHQELPVPAGPLLRALQAAGGLRGQGGHQGRTGGVGGAGGDGLGGWGVGGGGGVKRESAQKRNKWLCPCPQNPHGLYLFLLFWGGDGVKGTPPQKQAWPGMFCLRVILSGRCLAGFSPAESDLGSIASTGPVFQLPGLIASLSHQIPSFILTCHSPC